MRSHYPLEWFDVLITVTLNPAKTDVAAITGKQIATIITNIEKEKDNLQSLLKNQVFALTKQNQIELLVRQYHSSLIILLDQAIENQKHISSEQGCLQKACKAVISCVDELLSFIEVRFSGYLSLDERVPATYLLVTKKELKQKLDEIKSKFNTCPDEKPVVDIVFNILYAFTNRNQERDVVTFKEVLYKKEVVKGLENLEQADQKTFSYSALNELLIYLNFNCKAYMNYFTHKLAEKINAYDIKDKLDQLLLHHKEFNQMHRKPGVILNPHYLDLKTVLNNWFKQEIFYLEKKLHLSIIPLKGNAEVSREKTEEKLKVVCLLTVDQMALILRSADDLKILIARSLNEVFKAIAPHLSTKYKENISADSMRSKAYAAETRDKEIVTQTLKQMIKKIDEY